MGDREIEEILAYVEDREVTASALIAAEQREFLFRLGGRVA